MLLKSKSVSVPMVMPITRIGATPCLINGNGPLDLFRAASGLPNTGKDVSFTLPAPVAYWKDGENRLLFVYEKDPGYTIKAAQVIFTVPLIAPTGLKIVVP